MSFTYIAHCRSQWPCGLRRGSAALPCWDCGFESLREFGCLFVASGAIGQLEVSATGRSLFKESYQVWCVGVRSRNLRDES